MIILEVNCIGVRIYLFIKRNIFNIKYLWLIGINLLLLKFDILKFIIKILIFIKIKLG